VHQTLCPIVDECRHSPSGAGGGSVRARCIGFRVAARDSRHPDAIKIWPSLSVHLPCRIMVVSSVDARGRFQEVKVAGCRREPLEATGSRVKMGNRSQLAATLRARCTDAWEYCYLPVVSVLMPVADFEGLTVAIEPRGSFAEAGFRAATKPSSKAHPRALWWQH
jgi:hypothetical protein